MKFTQICALAMASLILLTACAPVSDALAQQDVTPPAAEEPAEPVSERWIRIGEEAYTTNTYPDLDPAAFFLETADSFLYLTLYDDMYSYDSEIFTSLSAYFYRYVRDTYGEDALFDLDKRVEYKNAWLTSLDASLAYPNNPESEAVLSQMTCTYDSAYEYIITLEDAVYSFYDYETIDISLAHTLMYYNTLALRDLRAELASVDPDGKIFRTDVSPEYIMDFTVGVSYRMADGSLFVGRYEDMLALAVQAMFGDTDYRAVWMREGMAEIYGKAKGYYYLTTYDRIFYLLDSTISDYLTPMADSGNAAALFHLGSAAYYYSAGGTLTGNNSGVYVLDNELYTHASALAEMDTEYFDTIALITGSAEEGCSLSRRQAGSLLLYLIEKTSLEDVLAVLQDYGTFTETFGGDFAAVQTEWHAWLEEKFTA